MSSLLPEWAPNIHPMLVHFPLAIFFFAALMDLLTFFLAKKWWDEKKTAVTYLIGAIAAIVVYFTGGMAAHSLDIPKSAYHAVGAHAGWAEWTVWFFGIYAVLRIILSALGKFENTRVHVFFFALSFVGLFFLYETGEHGAKLVFDYGLGTGHQVAQKAESSSMKKTTGFASDNEGNWSWTVGDQANKTFKKHFNWVTTDTAAGNPRLVTNDSTKYLQFDAGKSFFTSKKKYDDFEVDIDLQDSTLDGDLLLIHHLQDAQNYDYMALHTDGSASLGRVRDGSANTIEEGKFDFQAHHIKFVNSGEHQRGYVDGKLILHGHIDPAPAGGVGLKPEGEGSVLIQKITLSKLSGESEHQDSDEH